MMRSQTISKELCEVKSVYIPREPTCCDKCFQYFWHYCCFRARRLI